MAIIGLGIDIVEIDRIKIQVDKHPERLAKRVLTESEYTHFASSSQPSRFLAKRFAAKEAASKALGTGIAKGISFQHIEISNNELGAPILAFSHAAQSRFCELNGKKTHISISDEKHYAIATVILES